MTKQCAPFDRQEFAKLVYILLIDAHPRLMLRRGKQPQALTVQHVLQSYPQEREQVFEVLRAMLPFGCEITATGQLRRIPPPAQQSGKQTKGQKTKKSKQAVQQAATKTVKAAKKVGQAGQKAARRTKSGFKSRSEAYEWKGPEVASPSTDPALADRIRASMAVYADSTADLQQTPAWNRSDIGYWD